MPKAIQHISDTAKWIAYFRAEESDRPDAVFHDPLARILAGEKGAQIANELIFSKQNSWTFVARTHLFDEFVMQHVKMGFDTVVNLAAGLDTRPYRLPVPPSLLWIEVDLPGILREKERLLAGEKPNCELRKVELDLANNKERQELFKQINSESNKVLIVTEGLMIYLTDEQAASIASDLSAQVNFRRWVMDIESPALLTMIQENMGAALTGSNAKFQFAPQNGEAFFLDYGWRSLESKSKFKTAGELNRLNDELAKYAAMPEADGPVRSFPWTGVCLFENLKN